MDYKKLGQRIRDERTKNNLTQAQLAELVDISDTYIGQIERGERSLTLDTLTRLCNKLNVTIDFLLQDYIPTKEDIIVEQFKQIISKGSDTQKQMALDVIKTMFRYLDT
ncbi:helix-turn-helix domain-containing protein [Anaeropeptidivorans aminofermentans]|uniref:helix-turn-helix domain-containing protein n=1 Tax=Anaeropeptidivorans aminofermentans TaxID=2934315 RepID=UPI0020253AA9|nr:helix-turn-helix transcriptional regulator [Anaeropeptidivorans aminofermentans]